MELLIKIFYFLEECKSRNKDETVELNNDSEASKKNENKSETTPYIPVRLHYTRSPKDKKTIVKPISSGMLRRKFKYFMQQYFLTESIS